MEPPRAQKPDVGFVTPREARREVGKAVEPHQQVLARLASEEELLAADMGKVAAKRPLTSEEEAPRRVVTKVQKCQAVEVPEDDVTAWLQTAIPWAYGFTC